MIVVLDASLVVAALVDAGPEGQWAEDILEQHDFVAPSLLQVECTNVLRRLLSAGKLAELDASMAQRELMSLPVSLLPFEPFAERVWALRDNISSYDAWYVAVAESLNAPLATLDRRLINAPGSKCQFFTPESTPD